MYSASVLSTHTMYAHYLRLKKRSIEEIFWLRKYLFPSENTVIQNIEQYLTQVALHQTPLQLEIQQLLMGSDSDKVIADDLALRLESYIRRYDRAVVGFKESALQISKLEHGNEVFRSVAGKRNEYLYVLDRETCSQLRQQGEQGKFLSPEGHCVFSGNASDQLIEPTIELTGHQTNAVRVWSGDTALVGLDIIDQRTYGTDKAHREGIRLIPLPELELSANTNSNCQPALFKLADQLACTVLDHVTVRDCRIRAENGSLRGIVASDGMYCNLNIQGNTITTRSTQAISIAGLLTGGEFRGNTLEQLEEGRKPEITLYPTRIGRSMADDGVLNILSFKAGSECKYGPFGESDNHLQYRGEKTALKVKDLRASIPAALANYSVGLHDFDYHAYRKEYSSWTVRAFKNRDPEGYQLMYDWLVLREREYRRGQRDVGSLLPPPSLEQRALGANTVLGALTKVRVAIETENQKFHKMCLADLPYTPVRSFVMKRMAIRHGRVEPLKNLGVDNDFRQANLAFWLPKAHSTQAAEGSV